MRQRIVTGLLLIIMTTVLLVLPGYVMATTSFVFVAFAIWEEYRALRTAGHRVVDWPVWLAAGLSIPLVYFFGQKVLVPLIAGSMMLICLCVLFREQPELTDLSMSVLPMMTVLLPGLSIVNMSLMRPHAKEVVYLALTLAVPLVGDMMALFTGVKFGRRKLCPAVSPHKTVEGAIGGLAGSVMAAMIVFAVTCFTCNEPTLAILPPWWHYLILGAVGGVAGQTGDLFASLVKRHSGIKDFSNLFPGHGGMLDRLDSALFMAVLMYAYTLLA